MTLDSFLLHPERFGEPVEIALYCFFGSGVELHPVILDEGSERDGGMVVPPWAIRQANDGLGAARTQRESPRHATALALTRELADGEHGDAAVGGAAAARGPSSVARPGAAAGWGAGHGGAGAALGRAYPGAGDGPAGRGWPGDRRAGRARGRAGARPRDRHPRR